MIGKLTDGERNEILAGFKPLNYNYRNTEIMPILTEEGWVADWDKYESFIS